MISVSVTNYRLFAYNFCHFRMLPIRDATPANQAMFDPQNIYFDLESETMIELSQYLESQPVPAEQPSGLGESGGSYTIVPLSDSRFEQRLPDTPQHLHSHEWCTPLQVPVDMFPDDPSNCQDPWSPSSPVSRNSPLPFPSPAPTPEAALTNDESCVLPTFPPPDPSLFPNGKDGLLELAEATMGAEATGKMTPLIKEELRYQIQSKRRNTGLSDLVAEYKEPKPEVVSIYRPIVYVHEFLFVGIQ